MHNSTLQYTGTVHLETTHSKYIKQNSGTKHLFRLFSSLLSRQPYNALDLPAYLMLYDLSRADSENSFIETAKDEPGFRVLRSFIDLHSYTVTGSQNYETEFTATLTASMLQNKVDNLSKLRLAIVAGNQESLLAIVTFDHRIYESLQSGGQAVVRWQMSLTNSEESPVSIEV